MRRMSIVFTIIIIFGIFVISSICFAGSATLKWKPNTESDLAGYRIYYGTSSRSYGPFVSVDKNATQYTVENLQEGNTYYFALTAVDSSGNESGYSEEVSKTIPASNSSPPPSSSTPPSSSSPPSNSGSHKGDEKDNSPVIEILSPKITKRFITKAASISLSGTAKGSNIIARVTWNGPNGSGGTATGTSEWIISNIPLNIGWNKIGIKAIDSAGNEGIKVVRIRRTPSAGEDTVTPELNINKPKTVQGVYRTHERLCRIEGTASDNQGIAKITWVNTRTGKRGTANGTTSWVISDLLLNKGENLIRIIAWDVSGNRSEKRLTIDFTP